MKDCNNCKILDYALEEVIGQFDYCDDKKWRDEFKARMIEIAEEELNMKVDK